jgi:uncharacterized protein
MGQARLLSRRSFLLVALLVAGMAHAQKAAAQGKSDAPIASWPILAGLDYSNGAMTDNLQAMNGKRVRVPGYMVPLDDSANGVDEFILVPYYGACIHAPPPPPNQMVYVKMSGGRRVDVNMWDPIWIEGELHVTEVDSPYGAISHQMTGISVSPYTL